MDRKKFFRAIYLINKDLIGKPIEQVFNSIGSNIFIESGLLQKTSLEKGKKSMQREWSIWLGNVSWRITKKNKYFIGSGENTDIQYHLQKLLGKHLYSIFFISQFLDIEFNFEGDYKITTFFNWMEEDQWTIFLPDDSSIGVDCSIKEAITKIQEIAAHFQIPNNYRKLDLPLNGKKIISILSDKNDMPIFHFDEDYTFNLEACAWRLEHNNDYVIGCLDDDSSSCEELKGLIGRKIEQIDIANPMMDAQIQFEGGFVLKTFSCCHIEEQWKIYEEKKLIFCAKIPLLDNNQPTEY